MENISTLHVSVTPAQGESTGPAVVLLHGFTSRGEQDFPTAKWAGELASRGRETIVVDLPGHGGSPALTPGGYTTTQVMASLSEAVAHASTDTIDLVGYSLGARLAWDFASVSPKSVNRLVLGGLSAQEPFGAVDAEAAQAFFDGGPAPADPITGMMAQMMSAPGADSASLLSLVVGMGTEPFNPQATPPTVDTLFLAGDNDPMTQGLEEVAGLVADSSFERIPGDHMSALASDEFVNKTFSFLGV